MKNFKAIILIILVISISNLNSQSFSVFDVDTTNYPQMKAKFYATDKNGKQIRDYNETDLKIFENENELVVKKIFCPQPPEKIDISSVLVFDVSGSMVGKNIELAREAGRAWIDALPDSNSECAITGFDNKNYLYQDFTNDISSLKNALYKLNPYRGGTNYDAGLIDLNAGGLQIARNGINKKVIVFLTDGYADPPKIEEIVLLANQLDCKIFCVTLGLKCPESLREIAKRTGGYFFENVTTIDQAKNVYNQINSIAYGHEACEFEWQSKSCSSLIDLDFNYEKYNLSQKFSYSIDNYQTVHLKLEPKHLGMMNIAPGSTIDTSITVTAKNSKFNINNIESTNPEFSTTPKAFTLEQNESIKINIKYSPTDSSNKYTSIKFLNDNCEESISILSGFEEKSIDTSKTLELVNPNGGEVFVAGSDTTINWTGVSKNDKINIEFSSNNGKNWKMTSESAINYEQKWKVPNVKTDSALVRIIQKTFEDKKQGDVIWNLNHGSNYHDAIIDVERTKDNNLLLAGYTNGKDDDNDGYIMKIDALGEIIWLKQILGHREQRFNSIIETSNGDIIATGISYNDTIKRYVSKAWVVKLDKEGNLIWQKWFGGTKDDYAYEIIETYDNSFVICGLTYSKDEDIKTNHGRDEAWVFKINTEGELLWSKTFGGTGIDKLNAIIQTKDGGFIISGRTTSKDFNQSNYSFEEYALYIMKLDYYGEIEWTKMLHEDNETFIRPYTILKVKKSEEFYISGEKFLESWSIPNGIVIVYAGCLLKFNKEGEKLWEKVYSHDDIVSIESSKLFSNGDILLGGYKYTDTLGNQAVAFRVDSSGNMKWYGDYGTAGRDLAFAVEIIDDNDIILSGFGDGPNQYVNTTTYRIKGQNSKFQSDTSDAVFSIVKPIASANDIDMSIAKLGSSKDSVISNYIKNEGIYPFAVDSIWFDNDNGDSFSLISGIPPFRVDSNKNIEIRFQPKKVGQIESLIYIKTQADTLIYNIKGLGIEEMLAIEKKNIDFDSVYVNYNKDSLIKNIIFNKSKDIITIDSIIFLGPNNVDFTFDEDFIPYNIEINPNSRIDLNVTFKPSFVGRTSGRLAFYHKNQIEPLEVSLFGEGIKKPSPFDTCFYNFTYKQSQDSINLNLKNNAKFIDNTIQLTNKEMGRKGSAWFKNKVGIKNGFVTEFLFKFTDGNNYKIIDGSLPGADGIAFVIQANDSLNSGGIGGDIGFAGIPNSLAIEIDTYKNFAKGYEDPNGNHIAVFCNGTDFNKADHKSKALLGETSDIPIIHQDTIYKCKISYKNKQLYIFLNKENEEENLVLNIDVNIPDKIILNDYFEAFVGLTSATGNSVETHNILSWEFCSAETEFNVSNYKKFNESNIIYPNPNNGKFSINLEKINSPVRELFIYDPQGKIEYYYKMQNHFQKELKIDLKLTPSSYFIKIIADDNNYYSKFIIN